jgi:hypothetical protein
VVTRRTRRRAEEQARDWNAVFADLCRSPDTVDSPRRRAVAQQRERGLNPQKSAGRRQARDDGETLTRSMQRSRKGVPTIARAALVPAKKQRQPDAADHQPHGPRPKKWRNVSG